VIVVSAAILGAAVFPFSFLIILRYSRLRYLSSPPRPALYPGGAPVVGGDPRQEEPELFDVYIKPDLQVDEAKFEDILPMAVRAADTDPGEKRHTGSDWSSHSQVDEPEAPANEATSKTYDVAVLITMPTSHPRLVAHWDELGEYAIGTLKLSAISTLDDST